MDRAQPKQKQNDVDPVSQYFLQGTLPDIVVIRMNERKKKLRHVVSVETREFEMEEMKSEMKQLQIDNKKIMERLDESLQLNHMLITKLDKFAKYGELLEERPIITEDEISLPTTKNHEVN